MGRIQNIIFLFACIFQVVQAQETEQLYSIPRPSLEQYFWHEQERIMFVCLDPCTWQNREYDDFSTPLDSMVLPDLDTDEWCKAAMSWGAKEILFVAKHSGGFCWWQTETTDYSVKNIPWRNGEGDLLEELAASCGKYGLNLGIYVYPGDETWGAGIGSGGKTRDPSKQEMYNDIFRTQLKETLTKASKYTHVTEVWFDGSCIIQVGDILEEYAPRAVVFQGPHATIRWVGNERGNLNPNNSWSTLFRDDLSTGTATAQHSSEYGNVWAPLEVNTTLYDHYWFWSKEKEAYRKSLDELMRVFYASVGNGAVMLLNSTPNIRGVLPEEDITLYQALGDEIKRRFKEPITSNSGNGESLSLNFLKPTLVNHVSIMENYWFGERIRKFKVEGFTGKKWKLLAEGKHIGRKRILWFEDTPVTKLRLKIDSAVDLPLIKDFSAYYVSQFDSFTGESSIVEQKQCGSWALTNFSDCTLSIDLTPYIVEAGQYEISFLELDGYPPVEVMNEKIIQEGQESIPGILTKKKPSGKELLFSRTAVVTDESDIKLRVTLKGHGSAGVILIRRLQ